MGPRRKAAGDLKAYHGRPALEDLHEPVVLSQGYPHELEGEAFSRHGDNGLVEVVDEGRLPGYLVGYIVLELGAEDYLVKPIDFEELLSHVRAAVERAKIGRTVSDTQRNLRDWLKELDQVKKLALDNPGDTIFVPVDAFVTITLRNIVGALTSLRNVTESLAKLSGDQAVCQLLNCPRTDTLVSALKDTVEILKKSKSAFKSKEIGDLRRKLEELLERQP